MHEREANQALLDFAHLLDSLAVQGEDRLADLQPSRISANSNCDFHGIRWPGFQTCERRRA
jgi:hypothetical protein